MSDVIKPIKVTISGTVLLMHNGQLADPMNEYTKALKVETSKKKKSDDDHESIAHAEWLGGLYHDDAMGPYLPATMLDAMMISGARRAKLGKIFESCVRTPDDAYPLLYAGPRTKEALWSDPRFRDRRGVKVMSARVIRTRPKFLNWKCAFTVDLHPCELNVSDVQRAITEAGVYVGVGDFRPRCGRFVVDSFAEVTA